MVLIDRRIWQLSSISPLSFAAVKDTGKRLAACGICDLQTVLTPQQPPSRRGNPHTSRHCGVSDHHQAT